MGYNYTAASRQNAVSSTTHRKCGPQQAQAFAYQPKVSKPSGHIVSSPWYQGPERSLDGKPVRSGFGSLLRSIPERLRAWNRRRLATAELYALDDQLLRDIGIEPGQIEQFVDAVERAREKGQMPPVLRQIRNR